MKKIVGVITTKNRYELMKIAVRSAVNQTRKLDELIIVSDSDNDISLKEIKFLEKFNVTIIKNKYAKNYAGSLNTALFYILYQLDLRYLDVLDNTYIAMLDDDDYWHETYIQECVNVIDADTDFVVAGIHYMLEGITHQLTIPQTLSIKDFLVGNPHIQGSNTFMKLATILKMGCVDESMSSTIDRDMFVRCMMLNPSYKVVNKHLVYVNAFHDQNRVTIDPKRKLQGLKLFYRKYNGLMSIKDKSMFFDRINSRFKLDIKDFEEDTFVHNNTYNEDIYGVDEVPLLIGMIATDFDAGKRLIQEICSLKRKNTRVLILANGMFDYSEYKEILDKDGVQHIIITLEKIKMNNMNHLYGPFINEYDIDTKVGYIALSRLILHHHLYEEVNENEFIWILDEDVSLTQEVIVNNEIQTIQTPIDYIVDKYKDLYDVGVGNITYDPAIPALSTLRTNLVDYMYNKYTKVTNSSINLNEMIDHYYDLSDQSNLHLEFPFAIDNNITIDKVFKGKAVSRKLILLSDQVKTVTNHGGNTLIFNKEVLKVPNITMKIDNTYTRRGDFFWIQMLEKREFKLANLPFAVNHYRTSQDFNYDKELDKLKRDLLGSTFTKTYKLDSNIGSVGYIETYNNLIKSRLTKIIMSFYRIHGILQIINTPERLKEMFNERAISLFIDSINVSLDPNKLRASFTQINRQLAIYERLSLSGTEIELIKSEFNIKNLRLLGFGSEANVYTDEKNVYKVFHQNFGDAQLYEKSIFKESNTLYEVYIHEFQDKTIFEYKYEPSVEYNGGHASELVTFIRDLKKESLMYKNINARNFRVNQKNQLRLIDYGNSFTLWDIDYYPRLVTRTYQLLRYYHISIQDFKVLINLSYKNLAGDFNNDLELFKQIVNQRSKEDIHDQTILDLISSYKPVRLLDYGAGKCKISNRVSNDCEVSVYDIDLETLYKRSNGRLNIIENIEATPSDTYDMINMNLVLCSVENSIASYIMKQIKRLLTNDGKLIISICNPFYNDIGDTELRIDSKINSYEVQQVYKKRNRIYNTLRDEYHRPFNYYHELLKRNGFEIIDVTETDGAEMNNFIPIGEHLVLTCSKEYGISNNEKPNKSIVIYASDEPTYIIRKQWMNLLTQDLSNTAIFIICDNVNPKNLEYMELLFTKSRKLHSKVKILINEIKLGYEESILNCYNNLIQPNRAIDSVTILKMCFVFNNPHSYEKIVEDIKLDTYQKHTVFDEHDPFDNSKQEKYIYYPITIKNEGYLLDKLINNMKPNDSSLNSFRFLRFEGENK